VDQTAGLGCPSPNVVRHLHRRVEVRLIRGILHGNSCPTTQDRGHFPANAATPNWVYNYGILRENNYPTTLAVNPKRAKVKKSRVEKLYWESVWTHCRWRLKGNDGSGLWMVVEIDEVEGAAEHDCGPDQPKEGPLGSLVKHLAGVTGEEPAHRNYDRDQRQMVQTETQGWRQGEEIADLSKAKEEDRWVLDPSPDKGRRCAQRVDNWLRCRATKLHTHAEDRRIRYQLLQPLAAASRRRREHKQQVRDDDADEANPSALA
jgi:hypothetical protein